MARIIKKAEERRTEILDAAQASFMNQGYDATTVNDLIEAVKLSKGAFYHHFPSKEEVLNALVWRMSEQGLAAQEPLFQRDDLKPLEKLKVFFADGQKFKKENAPALRTLLEALYRDENLRLRLRAAERITEVLAPRLGKVLEEGKALGEFNIGDPEETARLILNLGSLLHEAFAIALKSAGSSAQESTGLLRKRVDTYERAVERILGISAHSLSVVDSEMIEIFLAPAHGNRRRGDRKKGKER